MRIVLILISLLYLARCASITGSNVRSPANNLDSTLSEPQQVVQSNSVCEDHRKRVQAVKDYGQPVADFDWSQLSRSDLLIVGENHSWSKPENIWNVIDKFTTMKSCIFLEVPSSTTSGQFRQILESSEGDVGTKRYRDYYRKILDSAESRGHYVIFVDDPEKTERDISLNQRDEYISKRIQTELNSSRCNKGVLIIGKGHVAADEPERITLKDHFERKMMNFATVNMQRTFDGTPNPAWSWNLTCTSEIDDPEDTVMLSNSHIADLRIWPLIPDAPGTYADFDFTYLVPGP